MKEYKMREQINVIGKRLIQFNEPELTDLNIMIMVLFSRESIITYEYSRLTHINEGEAIYVREGMLHLPPVYAVGESRNNFRAIVVLQTWKYKYYQLHEMAEQFS